MKNEWPVKVAEFTDTDRWYEFVKNVVHDFYDIDLVNNDHFRSFIEKT